MILQLIAIKRAFCTIAIAYKEFKNSSDIFYFAQIGTMLQEHYHGLLRGMSKGVDSFQNAVNNISKSNKLKPDEIIDQLEQISSYGKNKKVSELFVQTLISFTEEIGKYSLRIMCTNKHFHYGRRIILREITNANESKDMKSEDTDEDSKSFQNDINLIEELLNEEEEEEYKEEKEKEEEEGKEEEED